MGGAVEGSRILFPIPGGGKRGIPEIGNRKRGRLSKVERYAKAAKVIGPLGVKVLFEGFPGEKAMPLNEEFEGDLEKVWDPR